jgi:hypothetical protein
MLVFSYSFYIFVFPLFSFFSFFVPFPSILFSLMHFLCFFLCHILFCITNSYRYYFVIRYCKHLICIMPSLASHSHVCLLPPHLHLVTSFALCPFYCAFTYTYIVILPTFALLPPFAYALLCPTTSC